MTQTIIASALKQAALPDRHVHFVAIGGAGMGALAELFLAMGYEISGSDLKDSNVTRRLASLGARVVVGRHDEASVGDATTVVYSAAVSKSNPEILRARRNGVRVLSRAELLGLVFDASRPIAVSGTHGKTTTSSMLAWILEQTSRDPSYLVGGDFNDVGSGAQLGTSDLLVAEADEAFGSFLSLKSWMCLVTNVDVDHLDFYGTPDAIDKAFDQFLLQRSGPAVLCDNDSGALALGFRAQGDVRYYGLGHASFASIVVTGASTAELSVESAHVATLKLAVVGEHNLLNACGAIAAATIEGVDPRDACKAIESFGGVDRRFTIRAAERDIVVIDDYSHHPREVDAAITTARQVYPTSRIVVLFQPHTFTRTRDMADEFGEALSRADVTVVTDVFPSREQPIPGVTGHLIYEAIVAQGDRPGALFSYAPLLNEAAGLVAGLLQPNDVVITMGAGDVTMASNWIIEFLRDRA